MSDVPGKSPQEQSPDQFETKNDLSNDTNPIEETDGKETKSLDSYDMSSASKEIKQISSIQGDPQIEADISRLRMKDDQDLIADLEKFKDRPKPAFYDENQIRESEEEINSSIKKIENNIQKEGENKLDFIYQNNPEYRETIDNMREDGINAEKQIEILSSSPEPAIKKIFEEGNENTLGPWGNNVFRHWGGDTPKIGHWVTNNPERPYFAEDDLELSKENKTEQLTTFKLRNGTRYYESKKKSGVIQYFIVNPEEDLDEVKTIKDLN